jgi:orotidine-5'-phosphate decarboxylase
MREIPALSDRIIVALDVNNEDAVRNIVDKLGDSINFYKVGKELFVSEGHKIISYLKQKNKKIFFDMKFYDIPNTVSKAAAGLVKLGVDMFTIHAFGGKTMMERTVQAVKKKAAESGARPPRVLAVTVLTSFSQDELIQTGVFTIDNSQEFIVKRQVKKLALLAKDSGVDGVVASPLEIDMLRKTLGDDIYIVTPGIRPSSTSNDDQKRVMTPKEAIDKGADYLVIGRPILNAPDPREAVQKITKEITNNYE